MKSPLLSKEGPHYSFDDLEYWAEDGIICIVDQTNGDTNAVTCAEFALRADVINEEARRATYPSDKQRLQSCVLDMYAAWQDAKSQGDPSDPEVLKRRLREHKRAILTPSAIW